MWSRAGKRRPSRNRGLFRDAKLGRRSRGRLAASAKHSRHRLKDRNHEPLRGARARSRRRAQHRVPQRPRVLRLAVHLRLLDDGGGAPPRRVPAEGLRLHRSGRRASRRSGEGWPEDRRLAVAGQRPPVGYREPRGAVRPSADQNEVVASGPQDYSREPRLDFTNPDVLVASGATPTTSGRTARHGSAFPATADEHGGLRSSRPSWDSRRCRGMRRPSSGPMASASCS